MTFDNLQTISLLSIFCPTAAISKKNENLWKVKQRHMYCYNHILCLKFFAKKLLWLILAQCLKDKKDTKQVHTKYKFVDNFSHQCNTSFLSKTFNTITQTKELGLPQIMYHTNAVLPLWRPGDGAT